MRMVVGYWGPQTNSKITAFSAISRFVVMHLLSVFSVFAQQKCSTWPAMRSLAPCTLHTPLTLAVIFHCHLLFIVDNQLHSQLELLHTQGIFAIRDNKILHSRVCVLSRLMIDVVQKQCKSKMKPYTHTSNISLRVHQFQCNVRYHFRVRWKVSLRNCERVKIPEENVISVSHLVTSFPGMLNFRKPFEILATFP